jgi:hypothetical protein
MPHETQILDEDEGVCDKEPSRMDDIDRKEVAELAIKGEIKF